MKFILSLITLLAFYNGSARADDTPVVGRDAAAKYFQKRSPNADNSQNGDDSLKTEGTTHYLTIGIGTYLSSQAYEWGQGGRQDGVGGNSVDVTYRVGEWYHSMDLNIRIDYQQFSVDGQHPSKLGFMPLVTFPDADSKFPLYFGAGAGIGVFTSQISNQSPLSLDYELVVGARFLNVYENTGFFVESGIKNHLQLLHSGQLNGTFASIGAVFTF